MNDLQQMVIEHWLVAAVGAPDTQVVPNDEGNQPALVYNLVHLLQDGPRFKPYAYLPAQDEELRQLYRRHGLGDPFE